MILVVGDSHTEVFLGEEMMPYFRKFHITTPTAYQSIKHVESIENYIARDYPIHSGKPLEYLFFSFGEIDIRCHLGFIADWSLRDYQEVVEDCVDRYLTLVTYFQDKGYKVGIWGVIPSGISQATANGHKSYKTYEERNELTKMFNDYLNKVCKQKGIIYKSIFDHIMNDQENYSLYFAQDKLHLNLGMFQREKNQIDVAQIIFNIFSDLLPND